jgi:hypothetical protein
MASKKKIMKKKIFEERRKTNQGILPIVGNVINLRGIGEVLVQASVNGHMRFVERKNSEKIRVYEIKRDSLEFTGDSELNYGHPPLITDYDIEQGRAYGLLDRSLRSKKL